MNLSAEEFAKLKAQGQKRAIDGLQAIADRWTERGVRPDEVGVLSTGERIYVELAANQIPTGYTIAQALSRLGSAWTAELIRRNQY